MTASDLCRSRKKALACRGPSTHEAAYSKRQGIKPLGLEAMQLYVFVIV